jgi:hypothetical protein
MAQVDSENSIAMPVDTTRRHFLMAVGGGTVAMLGATIPEPAAPPDPVLGLIEAHRNAERDTRPR